MAYQVSPITRMLIATFGKPIMSVVEKGILAGVMWGMGKGYISGDAGAIAASLYGAVSVFAQGFVNTQNVKIADVNTAENGVRVVDTDAAKRAAIPAATETKI